MVKFTIKELRARKNVTQQVAATALGVSKATYNTWENNISNVAIGKVCSIAEYYGVSVDEIFLPDNLNNIQVG